MEFSRAHLWTQCRSNVDRLLAYKRVARRLKIVMELNQGPLNAVSNLTLVMVARSEGSVTLFWPLKNGLPAASRYAIGPPACGTLTSHPVLLTGPSERFP